MCFRFYLSKNAGELAEKQHFISDHYLFQIKTDMYIFRILCRISIISETEG